MDRDTMIRNEMLDDLRKTTQTILDKLKVGYDYGPDGPPVALTTGEAALVYRYLTEHLGIRHEKEAA